MKRILTIQDVSCLGKCSLTVALPLLSAMGVETVILPTAVLSTHTMFEGFTVKDLSDQLEPITAHWKKQGFRFDAIYTGYLGTEEEIEAVKGIIKDFADENTLVFIDPAMGDNGKLYPAFDLAYAKRNATLCGIADVIVPNITEACFMTDAEYKEQYDEAYVRDLLNKLVSLGSKTAILTGVSLSEGKTGAMGLDSETGEYFVYQNDRIPAAYHGTGDIFSSVVVGALMRGLSRVDAIKIAADYTADTIALTMNNPDKPWYGVDFEATIPELVEELYKKIK
ncbi:MAG: pyridoxamine kinase [Clostridiales bacterium]|nr:pyridoxamine kinase [Clostridia bacterium]MCR4564426.1 pyridoxamine kinase [Clostridiales bacterium]